MDPLLPLIAVALLVLCLIFKWQYSYWTRRGVEGLPPLPIFGNFFECFFMQRHITDVIDEIYCKFPKAKYIGYYKFHTPGLILKDLKIIKEVLSGDLCENYQNDGSANDNIYLWYKEKFFLSKCSSESTESALRLYFDEARFKGDFSKLRTISENLIEFIEGSAEWTTEEGFEAKALSSKFTIEAVVSCALNTNANCFTEPNSDFLELYRKHFLGTSFKGLFGLLSSQVEKRIESSLMAKFLQTESAEDNYSALFGAHNKHNLVQCLVTLFDVFESSNILLTYCLYELALNGDMQKKIRIQIKEIMSEKGLLTAESLMGKLPFLENVLFETLRMHSHIFVLKKKCTKGHQFPSQYLESRELFVKKGCQILIPVYSIHMDSEKFVEPYHFNPNRYSVSTEVLRPYPGFTQDSEYCLGNKYGFMLVKLAIATILSKFQIVLTSKNTGVLTFSKKTMCLTSEEGMWITFSKVS